MSLMLWCVIIIACGATAVVAYASDGAVGGSGLDCCPPVPAALLPCRLGNDWYPVQAGDAIW